jgi:hypothetical protein
LGTVVNDRAIVQLPLNERDTYQFLSLQPGVSSQLGSDLYYGSSDVGSVSVNGGRGRSNNFSVNGGDANDMFVNLPTVQPSPDSVQEFRILTNTFDAEYGRNSGSVVNVITKSGTNAFHGNLYEFHRNRPLNAKGYFDTSKAAFIQNQFGGTFGGPIKKDKAFFFGSYEGLRRVRGVSGTTVAVPDAAERTGDFSAGPAFGGAIGDQNVADVLNTRPNCLNDILAAGGTQPAANVAYTDIFPSNVLPATCQDPVAADLLRFVPSPNTSNGFFQAVLSGRDRSDQTTFRFDHHINNQQQFTAYYYFTDEANSEPFNTFQAAGANVPGFGDDSKQRFQQWNLSHTWTLSNNMVNEFRFTYMREAQRTFHHSQTTDLVTNSCATAAAKPFCFTGVSDAAAINDPTNNPLAGTPFANKIGITPGLGAGREGVPDVTVSGGFTLGNNFEGELPQVGNSFQWSDNLTKVLGNHTMKFGADLRRMRFDQTLFFEVSGYYNYFGGGTNDVGYANDLYPNYLLGLPDTYQQGAAQVENVRTSSIFLFGQDSWKIRQNLTLNYGLRWELDAPLTDIGHHVQTFRPGQQTTIYPCQISAYGQAVLGTNDCAGSGVFPTGLVVPGDKGIPNGMTQTYYKAFAPRIGIAYSPGTSGKTSIRAGWGMFYNPIEQLVLEQFSAEPPFGGSTFLVETMFNTPYFPQSGGFVYPNPFNGILNPPRGQPVDWSVFRPILLFGEFQPHMRTQYSDQYNFGIQRELAKDLVLQVSYVGSQAHRLLVSNDLNRATPQTCLDINTIANSAPGSVTSFGSPSSCNQFAEDNQFTVTIPNGFTFHMPVGGKVSGTGQTVNFVGIRPYSSPNCNPVANTGCPPDQVPVFSNIFAQDTIANSAYNSLQANLEKRFSNGLQLQAAYTFSKSLDQASSFEDILNPFDPRRTRSLSLFNAAQRFVVSYYYQLPVPKYSGVAGKILDGWAVSGITQFQSGFPIHLQSFDDNELTSSIDFASAGEPDQIAGFHKLDPRNNSNNYAFDPNSLTSNASDSGQPLCSAGAVFNCYQPSLFGRYGSAPRSVCCGPGLDNWDISFQKDTNIGENKRLEFRWDVFNFLNHTRFFNPDGNVTDGSDFGRVKGAGDPRLMQVALKLSF